MQTINPEAKYIGAGLEVKEAQILATLLHMVQRAENGLVLSAEEREFASAFGESLQFQIDNELFLDIDAIALMMGQGTSMEERMDDYEQSERRDRLVESDDEE